jgi:uncharacterized protein (DUF169 family)
MSDWKMLSDNIETFLRLRTMPVAVKFYENEEDIAEIDKVRKPRNPVSLCQLVGQTRHMGSTQSFTVADSMAIDCPAHLGFIPVPKKFLNGTFYSGVWQKTEADSAKFGENFPKLPEGKYKAVVLSPLKSNKIVSPDLVWIFANPAQMCLILCALQWEDYELFEFSFRGEGSCSNALIECMLSGKPRATIPCLGERVMGLVQDDEMEIAIPGSMIQKLVDGLNGLSQARTIRYPMPYYGLQSNLMPFLSKAYPGLDQWLEKMHKGARYPVDE